MKILAGFIVAVVCLGAETRSVPADKRIAYWKLRAEIAEQNEAFAASLTAEQKRTLEIVRMKASEMKSLRDEIAKECGAISTDSSGEPICASSANTPQNK